jgi:CheY-like chemotaxis protein
LVFSRNQYLKPTVLDLYSLVVDMEKMLHRLIGEDVELSTTLKSDRVRVKADPGQLEQVVLNLVVNARDAMPDGGKVTIEVEEICVDKAYCAFFPEARPGRFICLAVTDTGVGMDKETAEHAFEPFFTTKEHGSGLGLAVVYGIVRQHEGWIHVYSEPGHGTTFRVYLPASSAEAAPATQPGEARENLRGQGQDILLVEDEEQVRSFATKTLTRNGYKVTPAATASEAWHVFESRDGRFDLVFSDVILPDQSGLQLVSRILEHSPSLPVLMSSGYTDHKSHWSTIRERGIPFLPKPYAVARLLRAVKTVLDGQAEASMDREPTRERAQIDG